MIGFLKASRFIRPCGRTCGLALFRLLIIWIQLRASMTRIMSAPDSRQFSLIEASERRWTTRSSLVYDKGMLVAFIYDLSLEEDDGL